MGHATIKTLTGREILNAKGKPTVEAQVETDTGLVAIASVPSGTSTGTYEAFELYDGGTRYKGYGTKTAAAHVSGPLCDALKGKSLADADKLDRIMIELDGTANKSRLGANAILAASVALRKAKALSEAMPLYRSLVRRSGGYRVPDIIATVISGGAFSPSGLEFEDYMYVLSGFPSFSEELEALVTMRAELEKRLTKQYGSFPEDGGALAPPLTTTAQAFDAMLQVARDCGYEKHVSLGLDVAANEFFNKENGTYSFYATMDRAALCDYYASLCSHYPLTFIEDGFAEDDAEGFTALMAKNLGIQIVGDDLFVSNRQRLKQFAGCANGLLLKINQIGSVSEAIEAACHAQGQQMDVIVSLRSGETTDDFIADLAVAVAARHIKLGSPVRAERNAKYNRLLRIAEELRQ